MSKRKDNDLTNSLSDSAVNALARLVFEGYMLLDGEITLTGPTWVGTLQAYKAAFPGKQLSGNTVYWMPGGEYLVGPRKKKGGVSFHEAPGETERPVDSQPLTLLRNGEYYLNPSLNNVGDGKRRIYVNRVMLLSLGVPVGSLTFDYSHLLIHAVIWRWCAGMPIPGGLQVSHIGDAPLIVSPKRLAGEPGAYNRSRTVCKQGFLCGNIPNARCTLCGNEIRKCFHCPPCMPPASESLEADAFALHSALAPGLPGKVRSLFFCPLGDGWAPDFPECYQCSAHP